MKAATKKRIGLPNWDLMKLAGEARLDPRTVTLVLQGGSSPNRRQQVIDAAGRLGMALSLTPHTRAT
jgi:hypothetical protein